jgi:hypothetical protein
MGTYPRSIKYRAAREKRFLINTRPESLIRIPPQARFIGERL